MAKIIWTVTEEADWYNAFIAAMQKRGLPQPVTAANLREVMAAARDANLVLKVERRRSIYSVDAIRGDIAKRLITNGWFPRNYLTSLRRKSTAAEKAAAPDPRDSQLAQLTADLESANTRINELATANIVLEATVAELKARPGPIDLFKQFLVEVIREGLAQPTKPEFKAESMFVPPPPKEPLPDFERERRKDPVAAAQALNGSNQVNGRPKVAIVADLTGSDKTAIYSALQGKLDLRVWDTPLKIQGQKQFNSTGGRIIFWADHASHQMQRGLETQALTFARHSGSLPSLIERLQKYV